MPEYASRMGTIHLSRAQEWIDAGHQVHPKMTQLSWPSSMERHYSTATTQSLRFFDLLSSEHDDAHAWLSWSMWGDVPNPESAMVVFDTEDGDCDDRPISQAEPDSVVYPIGTWELHMHLDERAIKPNSFNQLRRSLHQCEHEHDSAEPSQIEICTPCRRFGNRYASSTYHEFASSVHIKRVEAFEPHATVRDVLDRIANGMCYGEFKGIEPARGGQAQSPEGHHVFRLRWGT